MRDESYLDDEIVAHADARGGRARWTAALGALASVLALALLIVWAYRLGVRDAHDVPVIRAVEGPAKIRPEDPGGARFDHQGRAVYGALEGAGPAEDADGPETLAPAPESLAEEDLPRAALAALDAEQGALVPVGESVAGETDGPVDFSAEVERLVAAAFADEGAPVDVALVDPTAQAPVRMPVAPPRPGSPAAERAAERVAAAPTAPAASEPAPAEPAAAAPVEAGPQGPLIQLGAYFTTDMAMTMWNAIRSRNGDLLAGRDPVLGETVQNGAELVLLRAGPFASLDEARALCAAMRGRNEDCLTVGPR